MEMHDEIVARIKDCGFIRKTEAMNLCKRGGIQLESVLATIHGAREFTDANGFVVLRIIKQTSVRPHVIGQPLLRGHVTVGA